MTNKEKAFYFGSGSFQLYGVLHRPRADATGVGYVFCHPFAEEKLWAHRVYVSFARELASRGHAVLRFDAMGHGDSDGEFEDATLDSYLADTESALRTLRAEMPELRELGLLGLRFGATVAALVADRHQDVRSLVLWEPVLEGDQYMQEVLRGHLTAQMVIHGRIVVNRRELAQRLASGGDVNIEGYSLTGRLFEQISALRLTGPRRFAGNCLLVQLGKQGEQAPRQGLEALLQNYPRGELRSAVEQPFWREIKPYYGRAPDLFATTLSWMDGRHG